jgi:hypothetical protein
MQGSRTEISKEKSEETLELPPWARLSKALNCGRDLEFILCGMRSL